MLQKKTTLKDKNIEQDSLLNANETSEKNAADNALVERLPASDDESVQER